MLSLFCVKTAIKSCGSIAAAPLTPMFSALFQEVHSLLHFSCKLRLHCRSRHRDIRRSCAAGVPSEGWLPQRSWE